MKGRAFLLAAVLLGWSASTTHAAYTSLTVDEFLYEGLTSTQASSLSANVSVMLSGSVLSFRVENTTGANFTNSSDVLTGFGFSLPSGITIAGGSLSFLPGAVFFNWSTSSTDPNETWGYNNPPIDSGHFQDPAQLPYTHVVGTIQSDLDQAPGPGGNRTTFAGPDKVAGPDFGLLSTVNTSTSIGGGVESTRGIAQFDLTLSGLGGFAGNLIAFIENNPLGVEYGSPGDSALAPPPPPPQTEVPEPTSALLLAMGGIGFGFLRRRRTTQAA